MNFRTIYVMFRTIPNGAYKYMRGLRRGFWQAVLQGPESTVVDLRGKGNRRVWASHCGIDGVTDRSRYAVEPLTADDARELMTRVGADVTVLHNGKRVYSDAALRRAYAARGSI